MKIVCIISGSILICIGIFIIINPSLIIDKDTMGFFNYSNLTTGTNFLAISGIAMIIVGAILQCAGFIVEKIWKN